VVAAVDGKDVSVHLGESTGPRHFNACQVKPSLLSAPIMFVSGVCAAHEQANNIRCTEIIEKGDPRAKSPAMLAAVQNEISGLIDRGTFKLAVLPDTDGKNIVPSRFVLAIKHEDGHDVYKARLCLGEGTENF
jgi:hypothetical protein